MNKNEQIQNTRLRAPVAGQIAEVNKREGEIALSTDAAGVIVLSPKVPFEIEVDIYEEDVVGIGPGAQVDITLVAFSETTIKGSVLSIDPAEKIIDGVVYYEVVIGFSQQPPNIKSGMTADLVIKTGFKSNVLNIPDSTVTKKDGKTFVTVVANGNQNEQEVELGMEGSDGSIEVISGLSQGQMLLVE
jgi:multidrug efflux pump subunit AcrA (membrane-fusion protein)